MSLKTIRYSVNFRSDYHIGSGLGITGIADDLLVKDVDQGLPLPGTTLKGVIKDATEDVVDALGIRQEMCDGTVANGGQLCGVNRDETCLMCLLFENRGPHRPVRFQSARRRDVLADLLDDERMSLVVQGLTRYESHNRIDRRTGTAASGALFSYELGGRKQPFSSSVTQRHIFASGDQEKDALALLVAGMRFVSRLGGSRRRGKGRCRLHIENPIRGRFGDYDWRDLIDHLPSLARDAGPGEIRHV